MSYTYKQTLHACYFGYITQAIVNNLAPLLFIVFQNQFNISFEMIGRLILINFGTQLIVDALAVKLVDKIGYRVSIVLAHIFSAVGLIALGILPNIITSPYNGLIIAVVIYAVGGGLIEVLVSPIVDSLPGDAKASAMSLLHSFYCWGQVGVVLISTILLKLMGNNTWYILPILWSLVPIYNLIKFVKVPLMPAVSEHEKMPIKQLLNSKLFLIALILMMSAGASEQAMSQWASLFAEKGLQVPKLMGDLLGPCLFAVLMGIGRTIYGVWGHKIHLKKALFASAALCISCYAVTVFVQIPIISLLSCALCGFSVALMWPGVFSMTAERYPKGGTAMFAMLAIFGDLGCSVGPWLSGVISDLAQKSSKLIELGVTNGLNSEQLGLKSGMLIAVIFPLIMLLGIAIFREKKKSSEVA
ncbi:MAG TPA: MFS transporter [Ruminiclostridium sp.]